MPIATGDHEWRIPVKGSYFAKPFSGRSLMAAITKALESESTA
jgi:hypothetical protein